MAQCDGSVRPGHPTVCENEATWQIHCSDLTCPVDFKVCSFHEVEARALVLDWTKTPGFCPYCEMPYNSIEHATQRWYPLSA